MKKSLCLTCILFALSLIFITSCENDNEIDLKVSLLDKTDYFPLHVGDSWEFDLVPGRELNYIHKINTDKEFEINGIDYFQLYNMLNDTNFFRKTSEGKVYEGKKTGNERLIFDLNAKVGKTWIYGSYYVTLTSKKEAVRLEMYTFNNCYRFDFDIPQAVDDELSIWLAPGIGVVAITGQAGLLKLRRSCINGVAIQF